MIFDLLSSLRSNNDYLSYAAAQTSLPHRHRLNGRAIKTKKSEIALFEVEVARVELASKQGARRLSTRLVVTYSFSRSPADDRQTLSPAPKFRAITEAHITLSSND